jgi:predicted DCC family thiol-disulfide oxidoreductase YuxK
MSNRGPFTMYYDADCPFCIRMIRLLKAVLRLRGSVYLPAQSYPEIHEEMRAVKSWIVVTATGEHLHGMKALSVVMSESTLFRPLGCLIGAPMFLPTGEVLYRWIESHRPLLSKLTGFMSTKPPSN